MIHSLDGAPDVDCMLWIEPEHAAAAISLARDGYEKGLAPPIRSPYRFTHPAGYYTMKGVAAAGFADVPNRIINIFPPIYSSRLVFGQ